MIHSLVLLLFTVLKQSEAYYLVEDGKKCRDSETKELSNSTSDPGQCMVLAQQDSECDVLFEVRKDIQKCRCTRIGQACRFDTDASSIIYSLSQQCTEYDNWRKSSGLLGSGSEISLAGHPYGGVVSSWSTCLSLCAYDLQCKQVVFYKPSMLCYGTNVASDLDQDGLGGSNINYISAHCTTACNTSNLTLSTRANANETSWNILNSSGESVCSGSTNSYQSYSNHTISCCLSPGEYTLICQDMFGDGWQGGYMTIGDYTLCSGFMSGFSRIEPFVLHPELHPQGLLVSKPTFYTLIGIGFCYFDDYDTHICNPGSDWYISPCSLQACYAKCAANPSCCKSFVWNPTICHCAPVVQFCALQDLQTDDWKINCTHYNMIEAPLQSLGLDGCTIGRKCGECQGDCDSDDDCAAGLQCFQRSSNASVPGCDAGGSGDVSGWDYCYQATTITTTTVIRTTTIVISTTLIRTTTVISTTIVISTTTTTTTTTTSVISTTVISTTTTTGITVNATSLSLVGYFILKVSNRSSFVEEPNINEVMKLAIAEILNVSVSWIQDVNVTFADDRRLQLALRIGRKLEATGLALSTTTVSGVKIHFRVIIPPDLQGDVFVTATIILERFDSFDLQEATDLIDKIIQSGLLIGGDSSYNVQVTQKIIQKEEAAPPTPSLPHPEESDETPILLIVGASIGLALFAMLLTFVCYCAVRKKTRQQSESLLKARVVAAAESKAQFLFPPSVITLECRNMLRGFLEGMLEESAKVFITFAMDRRPDDVEDCCPSAFYAAAVVRALSAHGVQCCMSLPGLTSGDRCHRLLSETVSTCKVLVIIETAALFSCSKCLQEIYVAQNNGIEVKRLRFETSLPFYRDWWSDVEAHKFEMASAVIQRLKLLPQLPEPPLTVPLQPEVLETFAHELKLTLSMLCLGPGETLYNQESLSSLAMVSISSEAISSSQSVDSGLTSTLSRLSTSLRALQLTVSRKAPSSTDSELSGEWSTTMAKKTSRSRTKRVKAASAPLPRSGNHEVKKVKSDLSESGSMGRVLSGNTFSSSEESFSPVISKALKAKKSSEGATRLNPKKPNPDCLGKVGADNLARTKRGGSAGNEPKSLAPSPIRAKMGNHPSVGRRKPKSAEERVVCDTSDAISFDRSKTDPASKSMPVRQVRE